jgi:hypothetical protein
MYGTPPLKCQICRTLVTSDQPFLLDSGEVYHYDCYAMRSRQLAEAEAKAATALAEICAESDPPASQVP